MSTVTTEDLDRVLEVMGRAAPAYDAWVRNVERQNREAAANAKGQKDANNRIFEFDSKLRAANLSIQGFTGGIDGAVKHLTQSILAPLGKTAFIGIAIFNTLWNGATKLNETWRDLTEVGATFGGSMFAMQNAANMAGLPLETFAKLQKAHNLTIKQSGINYWQVNRQLRENIKTAGMFGMSMDQLGDFTADYMEVFRRNGSLQNRSIGEVANDMGDLAATTTALAAASDKTREQITKLATEAMKSAFAFSGLASIPLAIRGAATKSIAEATAAFAAMPGTAGEYFSKFFADSTGVGANLTDGGATAVDAGLTDLAAQMDMVAQKFKAGQGTLQDQVDVQNNFIRAVDANRDALTAAAAGGNAAARQMLEMRAPLKEASLEDMRRAKEQAKKAESLTALFAAIDSIWQGIKSTFGDSFYKAFKKVNTGLNDLTNSPVFESLKNLFATMGDRLGTFLGKALTEANIKAFADNVQWVMAGLIDFTTAVVGAKPIWAMLGTMVWAIAKPIGMLVHAFSLLGTHTQKLIGMLIGGALLFRGFKKLFGRQDMVVNANNVEVNGDTGGLGGIGGGRGRGGRLGRIGGLARRGFARGGLRGGLAAGMRGLRGVGGLGGLARGALGGVKGLGGLARGAGRLLPWLGVGLEGLDYVTGSKSLSLRNMGKSALALGGGALGALGGGLLTAGLGGEFVGGAAGYTGGKALGDWLLGPDDKPQPAAAAAAAHTKAAAATTAAAASIAATNQSMMDSTMADGSGADGTPVVDPMQTLIDEIKGLRQDMRRSDAMLAGKQDQANRLLAKIETSAQSL